MFHINNKDEVKPCKAKKPTNCRFYQDEDDTRHYTNVSEAQSFIEEKLSKEHGLTDKKIRYSFVKEFKKQEEQFNEDFEGVPNRFFNADLRGKFAKNEATEAELKLRYTRVNGLGTRLLTSLSAPSDNGIDNEKAIQLLSEQGFENIQEINDERLLKGFKSNRAWKAQLEDQEVIVIDGNAGAEINRYAFRTGNEYFKAYKYWNKLDLRKVAGNARAEKKTGINIIKTIIKTESVEAESKDFALKNQAIIEAIKDNEEIPEALRNEIVMTAKKSDYSRNMITDALLKLEDAQLEGSNFIAQKKYVREHSGKIAGVFDRKKNTDDIRKDMMKNSSLNNSFKSVELDNDVDPGELADFEKAYNEIKDKLPPIPEGREPRIFVKKLGKHNATGLFASSLNSLAVDVRTSESFVHEYGHYLDLVAKDNASLRPEFREIAKEYTKNLDIPAGEPQSRREYLSTNTEIFARLFEHYSSSRLGIDNRLLNKEKFNNYDHLPITNNPELREKAFNLFDKIFEKNSNK